MTVQPSNNVDGDTRHHNVRRATRKSGWNLWCLADGSRRIETGSLWIFSLFFSQIEPPGSFTSSFCSLSLSLFQASITFFSLSVDLKYSRNSIVNYFPNHLTIKNWFLNEFSDFLAFLSLFLVPLVFFFSLIYPHVFNTLYFLQKNTNIRGYNILYHSCFFRVCISQFWSSVWFGNPLGCPPKRSYIYISIYIREETERAGAQRGLIYKDLSQLSLPYIASIVPIFPAELYPSCALAFYPTFLPSIALYSLFFALTRSTSTSSISSFRRFLSLVSKSSWRGD